MASKASSSIALFLSLNLVFFALVSACGTTCTPDTKPTPVPNPTPTPATKGACPRDVLKFGVCVDLLGGAVAAIVGTPADSPCCTLIQGLTDLDAAVCLCTCIKANVLGVNLNVPVSLSLLINTCGKKLPTGFQCS